MAPKGDSVAQAFRLARARLQRCPTTSSVACRRAPASRGH